MNKMSTIKYCVLTMVLFGSFFSSATAATFLDVPDLEVGSTHSAVVDIQKFLNSNGYTVNPTPGEPGSKGYESDYFGSLTQKALSLFQSSNNINPAQGYFGTKTKAKIDEVGSNLIASVKQGALSSADETGCSNGYTKKIERFGITWYFQDCEQYGTYANDDFWVVGPVTIWKIDPQDENLADGWHKHGTTLNPPPNTLNQGQGFDSAMDTGVTYSSSRNVAPAKTGQPLVVAAGNSVVSAKSVGDYRGGKFNATRFDRMSILTVVDQPAPPNKVWFRPPPTGTDKSFRWNTAQLDQTILQNKPIPSSAKPISEVLSYFEIPWMALAEGDAVQGMSPNNMPNYGRDAANRLNYGLLSLHLAYPSNQKQLLYIRLVQYGIDVYGSVKAGMVQKSAGGLDNGRKAPMVLAGLALNDSDIKEWSNASKHKVFAEDKQTFYVQQWNIDQPRYSPLGVPDRNGYQYEPYTSITNDKVTGKVYPGGIPEWGIWHSVESNKDSSGWANAAYRFVGGSQTGHALWAHMTPGAVATWNYPAFFDYEDRYFAYESTRNTFGVKDTTNGLLTFVYDMWNAHRGNGTNPPTTPPPTTPPPTTPPPTTPPPTTPVITFPANNQKLDATNSVTIQWNGSSSNYLIRLKDESTSASPIMEEISGTSKTYAVIEGHRYHFWMHPGTINEYVQGVTPQVGVYFEVKKGDSNPPTTPPPTTLPPTTLPPTTQPTIPSSTGTLSVTCSITDTEIYIGESTILDVQVSNLPSRYKLTWSGISTSKVKGFNKKAFDQTLVAKKRGFIIPKLEIKNVKNSKEKVKVVCGKVTIE